MRLLGRTGQVTGRTIAVNGTLKIGRAPENDLQLSIDGISRQHAQVRSEGDMFWVEDLGSANGTFLNGVRVTKERLAHLDVITLGPLADLIVDARTDTGPAAGPVTGDAFLEALDGPQDGSRIAVPAGELTIGRVAPSNVLIDSRVVSKLHARLRRSPDRLALDDLDSPNGTFVNGARITTNHPLKDGDTISIAGVRSFRVHLTRGTHPSMPVPAAAPAIVEVPLGGGPPPAAFNQEWKTKLVWSADELSAVEAERARVIDEVRRSTGGLPGEEPARKTEFIGRGSLPLPPEVPAAAPEAAPPARKTEFMGRDHLPVPPAFAAQPAPSAPPAEAPQPKTTAYRPGADLPPVFAEAAPASGMPPAEPPVPKTTAFRPGADLPPVFAEAPPLAAPSAPARPAGPAHEDPLPATSAFRPAADLPPVFGDLPPTGPVIVPQAAPVLCLRGPAGEFALTEGTHVVGRQEGVSVFISDRQVSRKHAEILVQQGRATLVDRASANGTFVNGDRLAAPRVLRVGDQVKFGDLIFVVAEKK